jgi:flagellar protein FlaG
MLIQNTSNAIQAPLTVMSNSTSVAGSQDIQTPSATAPSAIAPSTATAAPSASQLQSAIQSTNQAVSGKGLEFSVDDTTKQTVVKLMDTKTGDVIGQFPSKQMIDISQAISLMQQQLQQASLSKAPVQSVQGLLIKQQA